MNGHQDDNQLMNSIVHSRKQLERGDRNEIDDILDAGLLSIFHYFLNHPNQHIRNESALCIVNISSQYGYSSRLAEEGVLDSLITLFHKHSSIMFGPGGVMADSNYHQMAIIFMDYLASSLSNIAAEDEALREKIIMSGVASRHNDILLNVVERYHYIIAQDLLLEFIQDCTNLMATLSISTKDGDVNGVLPLIPSIKASFYFNDEIILQNGLRSFIHMCRNTNPHHTNKLNNPFNLSFNPNDVDMIRLINNTSSSSIPANTTLSNNSVITTTPVNIVSRILELIEQFYQQQQHQHHQQQQSSMDYLTLELLLTSLSMTLLYYHDSGGSDPNNQFLTNSLKMISYIIINEQNNDIVDISCKLLHQLIEIALNISTTTKLYNSTTTTTATTTFNLSTIIHLPTILNSVLSRDYYSDNIVYMIEFFLHQSLITGHLEIQHAIGHLIQSLSYHLSTNQKDTCNYILLMIDTLIHNQKHLFTHTCNPSILNQQLTCTLQQYIDKFTNSNDNNNNNTDTTTILNSIKGLHSTLVNIVDTFSLNFNLLSIK